MQPAIPLLALLLACGSAHAQLAALGANDALEEARLGEMRGGYITAEGLLTSFGITRTVSVNGEVIAVQGLVLRDIGRAFAGGAPTVEKVGDPQAVVQIGSGNSAGLAHAPSTGGSAPIVLTGPTGSNAPPVFTAIQNTLSNISIQTRTTIDATLGNLGAWRNYRGNVRDSMLR